MISPGVLDYIFAAVTLIAIVRCVFRGFVAEVLAVASLGGGIICGILFSAYGAEIIARGLGESPWNRVIAFLIIFLFVYLVMKILEGVLYRAIESVALENLDKALAFFLGIIEGTVVSLLILILLLNQPFFDVEDLINSSIAAGFVADFLPVFQGGGTIIPEKVF